MHQALRLAPALVAVIFVASGCRSVDTGSEAPEDTPAAAPDEVDGGLGTKPDDSGVGTKDDGGLGTKDGGLGTKDGGLGSDDASLGDDDAGTGAEDAGVGTEDAGVGGHDAGGGTHDAGMQGPDAGEMNECLACAEERCGTLTSECLDSPACVEQGKCDLTCLGGFHAMEPLCFQACTKDPRANEKLFAAASCAFALCPKECHTILGPCF